KLLLGLLISASSSFYAFSNQISVRDVFENLTEQTSIDGLFSIWETNQTFQINSTENFIIELLNKGKYHLEFSTTDLTATLYYPAKITAQKNTVNIRLENKTAFSKNAVTGGNIPIKDISNFSEEQIEAGINDGSINFNFHGLTTLNP